MTVYREQRSSCVIEADARDLQDGCHWQPWLRLTRHGRGVSASSTFDGLKPIFGTEDAALRYAAELGRSLVDEGSTMAPAALDRESAARPLNHAFVQACAYRSRNSPLARGCRTANYMVRALTGLFARAEFSSDLPRQPRIEL
jgi:hypothetical protein